MIKFTVHSPSLSYAVLSVKVWNFKHKRCMCMFPAMVICTSLTLLVFLLPAGIDLIAAFYGCLYAGCVPITVRPPHPQNISTTLPTVKMIVEVRLWFGLTQFLFETNFTCSCFCFSRTAMSQTCCALPASSCWICHLCFITWCGQKVTHSFLLPFCILRLGRSVTRLVWWPQQSSVSCCAPRRPWPLWT